MPEPPLTAHRSLLTVREGQTFAGESLLARYASFVKLPHTLFALPFALLGVLAASMRAPVTWRTVALVVVAFSAARWVAMGFNRIADREYDARNPRTLQPRAAARRADAAPGVGVGGGRGGALRRSRRRCSIRSAWR